MKNEILFELIKNLERDKDKKVIIIPKEVIIETSKKIITEFDKYNMFDFFNDLEYIVNDDFYIELDDIEYNIKVK